MFFIVRISDVSLKAKYRLFDFELGYFTRDADLSMKATESNGKPVFNKTVGLRDTWGKIIKKA